MSENIILGLRNKYLCWLVWGTFGVLLILASLYYEERTMIMDTAYQGFSILRKDAFSIQVNRFGAIFVQAFPLLSARAGLPLNITLWLYSVSFIIEPLICVLILWFGVKHRRIGLAMILFLTLLVSHTFYWVPVGIIPGHHSPAFLFWHGNEMDALAMETLLYFGALDSRNSVSTSIDLYTFYFHLAFYFVFKGF
jgi:hypothetical protein